MTEPLRTILPSLYQRLLPAVFEEPTPEEPKATCHDCAMCPPKDPAPGVTYFRPDTKCCTYQPHLPNYLVGAILADQDPAMAEGQRRIRAHLETRVGVTPRWLGPSRKRAALFRAARESSFGRSLTLRCPYLSTDGLCTVWRHRESVCSTFFCKYASGADGQTFWRAVNGYLRHVERELAFHAVDVLAAHLREPRWPLDQMSLEELEDRPPTEEDYAAFWHEWRGREEAFYRATHELVSALSREDFERVVGAAPPELAALQEASRVLRAPVLPERLRLDLYRPPIPVEGGYVVSTYSKYEPINVTSDLLDVLRDIRPGETVAELRARVLREQGVELPEELLLGLYQLRVLIPPSE